MRNDAPAMLATIALAALIALLLGFFDPGSCVVDSAEGFTSCSDIAFQQGLVAWILVAVIVTGFTMSAIRRRKR